MNKDKEELFKIFSKERIYTEEEHSVLILLMNHNNVDLLEFRAVLKLIEKIHEMHDENSSSYANFLENLKIEYS